MNMFAPQPCPIEHCNCPEKDQWGAWISRIPVSFQVKKDGPNNGRWFWKCPNNTGPNDRGCGMFCWFGEEQGFLQKQRNGSAQKRPRVEYSQDTQAQTNFKQDLEELASAICQIHKRLDALEWKGKLEDASKAYEQNERPPNPGNLIVPPSQPPLPAANPPAQTNARVGLLRYDQQQPQPTSG